MGALQDNILHRGVGEVRAHVGATSSRRVFSPGVPGPFLYAYTAAS